MINQRVQTTMLGSPERVSEPLDVLASLGRFDGPPSGFWPAYLAALCKGLSVRRSLLLLRSPDNSWRAVYQSPIDSTGLASDPDTVFRLAEAAYASGVKLESTRLVAHSGAGLGALLRSLPDGDSADGAPAVLVLLSEVEDVTMAARLALLKLAVETPEQYAMGRRLLRVADNAERLHEAASLAQKIGSQDRFLKAAMMLCGALAARFDCDRVSIGWLEGNQIRLQAVSNIENFDRNMAAAQLLEDVMEESLDQDSEIVLPAPSENLVVMRTHLEYARTQGVANMLSVPIRVGDQARAVLTAERHMRPFDESQRWEIRLISELVASPLSSLQQNDRWAGRRWADATRTALGKLWGLEHSLSKFGALLAVATLVVAAVLPWPYRIEASAGLRSDDLIFVPAPFDGFLREVKVEIGDQVSKGAVAVALDTRELSLEQAMVEAEVGRFARESEKARAAGQLAEMQIALSRQAQVLARLQLIRDHLGRAEIRAPISGVVVEGELRKNLGGPVKKGELLLKIARLDSIYVELEIDQTDIHEAAPGRRAELAFVGRPDLKVALLIERIEPISTMKDGRNYFLARARVLDAVQNWWRPGMGGTARIEAGNRTLLWVLSHRTVRFVQRTLWL